MPRKRNEKETAGFTDIPAWISTSFGRSLKKELLRDKIVSLSSK
jgi:hypothetical protein